MLSNFWKRSLPSARSPRRTAAAAPKNSALPELGSSTSACSMMRPARPSSSASSLMVSASASPTSASAFLPPASRSARSNERSASGNCSNTTYERPSISQPFRSCGSLSSLRARRATIVCGESSAGALCHDQLVRVAYNTAEPMTNTPAAARAVHGAGASCVGTRRSNGTAMTATPAMMSTPANNRKVIIRSGCPLPEAHCPA